MSDSGRVRDDGPIGQLESAHRELDKAGIPREGPFAPLGAADRIVALVAQRDSAERRFRFTARLVEEVVKP